jgi:inner membrane protein
MDSITQFTLGAAVGEAVAGRKLGNKALLWGGIAGTIPDLDVFANFFLSELDAMAVHRGISHSLFFAILAPFPIAWLINKLSKKKSISLIRWYWLFFLGFLTHIFIDVCTAYGTQVFQPFSNARLAINNISVADPLYTIPFLLFVVACAFCKRSNKWRSRLNWMGIGISSLYLLFTFFNLMHVNKVFEKRLAKEDIEFSRFMSNPTILNNILWHAIAETEDGYVGGYYSLLDNVEPFHQLHYYDKSWELLEKCGENPDLEMLKWFSDGYYIIDGSEPDTMAFNDLRYGPLLADKPNKKPVFLFNYFITNCTVRPNQYIPGDGENIFKTLFMRIKGI